MTHRTVALVMLLMLAAFTTGRLTAAGADADQSAAAADAAVSLPSSEAEAQVRARVLHETIHGALQVMHRDFFDPDQRASIPSRSLEDVFKELGRSWQVDVHWLAVSADAMNVDNNPRDEFEKEAVRQLASGKPGYEAMEGDVYRFAGAIRLSSQCLRCHAPRRTSTADRVAGLVISMPLRRAVSP